MDWNIQSRSHVCHECGEAFGDRQVLHTLLFSGREGLERVDVCVRCWEGQYSEAANHRRGFISHWQTVHLVPPPPNEVIQKESAETLLRKLVERNAPEDTAACFVLAIMLERKRLLKMQGKSQSEGRRLLHYEHAKTGDIFTVSEVDLRLDQLEAVQKRVSELLEQGLPESGPVPSPATDEPERSAVPENAGSGVAGAAEGELEAGASREDVARSPDQASGSEAASTAGRARLPDAEQEP